MPDAFVLDIQETSLPVVVKIIAFLSILPDRDYSPNNARAKSVTYSLAEENDVTIITGHDSQTIANLLIELQIGPRTAHYVWRSYKLYQQTGDWGLDRISY